MPKFLVVLDTPSIKKFVFASDKLAEITGSSAILDYLNRIETKKILESALPMVDEVYCNGGTGQFIVEADATISVEKALKKVELEYRKHTCDTASIVWGYAAYQADYCQAFQEAHRYMGRQKARRAQISVAVHNPFVKDCESCANAYAQIRENCQYNERHGGRWLCGSCRQKQEAHRSSEKHMAWFGLYDYLVEHGQIDPLEIDRKKWFARRIKEFEPLASRDKKIGVIYADGNSMGKLLKELNQPDISKVFSNTVDESIREACYSSIARLCRQGKRYKAAIMILGGDDLVIVVSAAIAIEFAIECAKKFQQLSREKIQAACSTNQEVDRFFSNDRAVIRDKGFTISLGIAIGKAKQPFYLLLDQAEQMLKSAKKKGNATRSYLFDLQRQHYDELDRGEISRNLRQQFSDQGISLAANAIVTRSKIYVHDRENMSEYTIVQSQGLYLVYELHGAKLGNQPQLVFTDNGPLYEDINPYRISSQLRQAFSANGLTLGNSYELSGGEFIIETSENASGYAIVPKNKKILEVYQCSEHSYYAKTHIDFHDATQTAFCDVAKSREYYRAQKNDTEWCLTLRPYSRERIERLLYHAKQVKKSGWPNTKLQHLREACFAGLEHSYRFYHPLLHVLAAKKTSEAQHDALKEALDEFKSNPFDFYWTWSGRRQNVLLDLIEVISYLEKE